MTGFGAADELDHHVGATSAWSETWEFRAATDDLSLAVAAAVVRRPAEGRISYWAVILGRSRPPVVLVEHDIDPPRVGLELRGSGVWADHICEEPHRRWSIALEAYGLALDDPADLVTTARGLPVAMGFDLEWLTPTDPVAIDDRSDRGYLASGTAHGELLVGDNVLVVDAPAHRLHRWGTGPPFPQWWSAPGRAGWGPPPGPVESAAHAYLVDAFDRTTSLVVGHLVSDAGTDAPAWRSAHVAHAPS